MTPLTSLILFPHRQPQPPTSGPAAGSQQGIPNYILITIIFHRYLKPDRDNGAKKSPSMMHEDHATSQSSPCTLFLACPVPFILRARYSLQSAPSGRLSHGSGSTPVPEVECPLQRTWTLKEEIGGCGAIRIPERYEVHLTMTWKAQ